MSKNETVEPSKFQPTYSGFLIDKLNKIELAWDQDMPEAALRRALRLVNFLPKELKKKLKPKKEIIVKALNSAYRISGVDYYTTQQIRNRKARTIASLYLEPFVDEMLDWLDERGYLEEKKRIVPEGHE